MPPIRWRNVCSKQITGFKDARLGVGPSHWSLRTQGRHQSEHSHLWVCRLIVKPRCDAEYFLLFFQIFLNLMSLFIYLFFRPKLHLIRMLNHFNVKDSGRLTVLLSICYSGLNKAKNRRRRRRRTEERSKCTPGPRGNGCQICALAENPTQNGFHLWTETNILQGR